MGTVDNGEREEEGRSVEKVELKLELEWKVELSLVALSLNNVKNRVFLWLDVEKSKYLPEHQRWCSQRIISRDLQRKSR